MDQKIASKLLRFQKEEINGHAIYSALSKLKGVSPKNKKILSKIAEDELNHYNTWKKYTSKQIKPNPLTVLFFIVMAKIFGVVFCVKMMESLEGDAQEGYKEIVNKIPEAKRVLEDEERHERLLVDMLKEERIEYISSMVLGISDAIVELTGALAGVSLALQNAKLIGIVGVVTGISASLSMGSSEYLSQKADKHDHPLKAALYTTAAYFFTVLMLVVPFFVFNSFYNALILMFIDATVVILIFSFFMSVVKETPFKRSFLEMFFISFSVSIVSFIIGYFARKILNVEI
ncbi:VIT1/CCC1 transporter family protein [Hippea sp. KM1]|uniref:VIT1/CCC1 transporter family protein n=1 Tax=Hippea sp. KM1 TaxID=944481 RepID=UPI00046CDC9D|nr:VIT1/CCC1 transporter family protein [Hippea sp. KM1]